MKSRLFKAGPAPVAALTGLAAVAIAGCGAVKNTITPQQGTANTVTVALAGQPSALYIGIYEAQALGLFKQTDMRVKLVIPAAGDDPVTMVHDGQVLIGISSEPNVLLHRNEDQPVVGVAALVHGPLPAISVTVPAGAASGGVGIGTATTTVTTPTATTATTSTPAAATTAPTTATATTATATTTTTAAATTTTTAAATTTTTAAATTTTTAGVTTTPTTTTAPTTTTISEPDASLWPAKLQQLLSSPGYPTYDGLVVVVRKGTIVDDAPLVRRFVQAVARGYRAARANPTQAISNLIAEVPSLAPQKALEAATLQAALPYFFPAGLKVWGYEREAQWNSFGSWLTQHQLLSNPNAITDASTNELLPGEGV